MTFLHSVEGTRVFLYHNPVACFIAIFVFSAVFYDVNWRGF